MTGSLTRLIIKCPDLPDPVSLMDIVANTLPLLRVLVLGLIRSSLQDRVVSRIGANMLPSLTYLDVTGAGKEILPRNGADGFALHISTNALTHFGHLTSRMAEVHLNLCTYVPVRAPEKSLYSLLLTTSVFAWKSRISHTWNRPEMEMMLTIAKVLMDGVMCPRLRELRLRIVFDSDVNVEMGALAEFLQHRVPNLEVLKLGLTEPSNQHLSTILGAIGHGSGCCLPTHESSCFHLWFGTDRSTPSS